MGSVIGAGDSQPAAHRFVATQYVADATAGEVVEADRCVTCGQPEASHASRCLCAAYDDGWMDCTAHTKHCGVEVNEDWLCVVCGINVQIHGRSDDELRRLGQGAVRRPQRDGDR